VADLTQPTPDVQDPDKFVGTMGSFWAEIFAGYPTLRQLRRQDLALQQSADDARQELMDGLSRRRINVHRNQRWRKLTLTLSDMNSVLVAPVTFGSDEAGNYGGTLRYGQASAETLYRFPLPARWAEVPLLVDSAGAPTQAWTAGVDYRVVPEDGYIEFGQNPFNLPVARRSVYDADGELTDRLDLWAVGVQYDAHDVYEQFGFALNLAAARSSEAFRRRVSAHYQSLVAGPNSALLRACVAAACGLPAVINASETVEDVFSHPLRLQVITDQSVYDYHPDDAAVVEVGDTVYSGDCLSGAVVVMESADPNETFDALTGLQLYPSMFDPDVDLAGPLTFLNEDVDVIHGFTGEKAVAYFDGGIDGDSGDVTNLWAYAEVVAEPDACVAHALRKVEVPAGVTANYPRAAQIHDTANPMLFVIRQLLGACLVVVKVDEDLVLDTQWAQNLALLRQLLPPHMRLTVTTGTVADLGV